MGVEIETKLLLNFMIQIQEEYFTLSQCSNIYQWGLLCQNSAMAPYYFATLNPNHPIHAQYNCIKRVSSVCQLAERLRYNRDVPGSKPERNLFKEKFSFSVLLGIVRTRPFIVPQSYALSCDRFDEVPGSIPGWRFTGKRLAYSRQRIVLRYARVVRHGR